MSNNTESHLLPHAFFMGDFNTGKSTLINALLRREILPESRKQSRTLPTFVSQRPRQGDAYAALSANGKGILEQTPAAFAEIHRPESGAGPYQALAALLPVTPFSRLVFVDTAGLSSDAYEAAEIESLPAPGSALLVAVTDIEYWNAKHTMAWLQRQRATFGAHLLVVANKADHLNADEIRRISERAPGRMESFGIDPAPRFYAVSARLEAARLDPDNEYRQRTKRPVRDLCDSAFDALRVALYEFEAAAPTAHAPDFDALLNTPLAAAFLKHTEGARDEVPRD